MLPENLANLTAAEKTITRESTVSIPRIIESTASTKDVGNGFTFRSWTYAIIPVKLDVTGAAEDVYTDTGCGVTLIDRAWLFSLLPDVSISKMATPLKVRGVGSSRHKTSEYVTIPIYLLGQVEGKEVLAYFRREMYLIDDLRAKMLLSNDILGPEGFIIDVANSKAYISSYNVAVPMSARQRGQFITRNIHAKEMSLVPPHSEILIPTKSVPLPRDRDFLFEPSAQVNLILFAHLVDYEMTGVLVRNDSSKPVQVPRKFKLGRVLEIDYKNCFQANIEPEFTITPPTVSTPSIGVSQKIPGACQGASDNLLQTRQDPSALARFT